jgi:hypothetical protein
LESTSLAIELFFNENKNEAKFAGFKLLGLLKILSNSVNFLSFNNCNISFLYRSTMPLSLSKSEKGFSNKVFDANLKEVTN